MIKYPGILQKEIFIMEYSIIRSKRKTISVEITRKSEIIVRAPLGTSKGDIDRFVSSKSSWITKTLNRVDSHKDETFLPPFTEEELLLITKRAREYISSRVIFFADSMDLAYGRVCIKHQKTRWGSCSGKGNLNFNCLLMLCPLEVIDYVIIHELCHLVHQNHSADFWREVEKYIPDYKLHRKWLKENGVRLISRLEDV